MKRHPTNQPPLPLPTLISHCNGALERWRAIQMIPFQRRAEWLIKRIQRELPNVSAIVSCNGESWLVPVGYPYDKVKEEANQFVTFKDQTTGETHRERVTNILRAIAYEPNWLPDVSKRCLAHLEELARLATYCCDNLEQIDTSEPV